MISIAEADMARTGRGRTVVLAGTALLLALAALYMARTVLVAGPSKDFAYFWIAGQLWMAGENPYASGFSEAANAIAAANPEMTGLGGFHRWLYAPHIWGLVVAVGSVGYETGRLLWGALGGVLVLAGTWLTLASTLYPRGRLFPLAWGAASLLAAVTMGTAAALATGQLTGLSYFALAALAYGVLRRRSWAVFVALIILTLKPSVALPFVGLALAVPALRVPLVLAGAVSAALALPVLLVNTPGEVVAGYLDGLAAYGHYEANAAFAATGLRNLAFHAFGVDLSGLGLVLAGTAVVAAIARASLRDGRYPDPALAAPALGAAIAAALLFVPLHTYDLTLVLVLLLLAGSGTVILAVLAGLVLLFRPNRLSDLLGIAEAGTKFPGSLLSSLVLLGLAAVTLAVFLHRRARTRAPTAA